MTGRQRHRIIEKEQRRPGPRGIERMRPSPILDAACNPQRTVVMAHHLPGIVRNITSSPIPTTSGGNRIGMSNNRSSSLFPGNSNRASKYPVGTATQIDTIAAIVLVIRLNSAECRISLD